MKGSMNGSEKSQGTAVNKAKERQRKCHGEAAIGPGRRGRAWRRRHRAEEIPVLLELLRGDAPHRRH